MITLRWRKWKYDEVGGGGMKRGWSVEVQMIG